MRAFFIEFIWIIDLVVLITGFTALGKLRSPLNTDLIFIGERIGYDVKFGYTRGFKDKEILTEEYVVRIDCSDKSCKK